MTRVQDVVRQADSGGPASGEHVDSRRTPPTATASNHRNLSFRNVESTARDAQLVPPDLQGQGFSTESTAPTTTTKFQLIPRRATAETRPVVWTAPAPR